MALNGPPPRHGHPPASTQRRNGPRRAAMMRRFRFVFVGVLGGLGLVALWVAPAAGQTWVSSWGGRGPLSTTITTSRTVNEPTPNLSGRTVRVMARLTTGGSQV